MRSVLPLAFVFLAPSTGIACQCGVIPAPPEALARAKVVFAGVVREIVSSHLSVRVDVEEKSIPVKLVKFSVQRSWKESPRELTLVSGLSNCDFRFERGRAYLVYAESAMGAPEQLAASICMPTKLRRDASKDVTLIGPGQLTPASTKTSSKR